MENFVLAENYKPFWVKLYTTYSQLIENNIIDRAVLQKCSWASHAKAKQKILKIYKPSM